MKRHFGFPPVNWRIASLFLLLLLSGCTPLSISSSQPSDAASIPPAVDQTVDAEIEAQIEARIEAQVEALLAEMTLLEKIGQMTQVEKGSIQPEQVSEYFIGSVLSGGGGGPIANTPAAWLEMTSGYHEAARQTRLSIPLLYGVDAVHGHNNVLGATIFPHNIGLGATRNADLVERIGRATALEVAATGIDWDFAPVVAVPQDIRWGRTYEGYAEETALVSTLGTAFLHGLQGDSLSAPETVLGTPKHYVADGAAAWGTSTSSGYQIDQGDAVINEATLRAIHLPPYIDAIENGARSIMVSFSSWNGTKLHADRYLLTDVLKGELGFDGFLVSDWQAIDQIPGPYESDVATAINAGIDMVMVPYDYETFISTLTSAVENGDVASERIDDAVRRILRVKRELGLFEPTGADAVALSAVGSAEHRELAREAVQQSLVLLQNRNGALPLNKATPLIYVGGAAADDIGIQSGGWTISWQGRAGEITPGTTILAAIEQAVGPDAEVVYSRAGEFPGEFDERASVGIAVVGERPYAEGQGDRADLALSDADASLIEAMRASSDALIVVLATGRPLIITDLLGEADAWVVAWLPGTEGQGVADVLFGDVEFVGRLPFTWPRTMQQIPIQASDFDGCDGPLFPFGYGLTAEDSGGDVGPLDCS